jgi:MFS family permease
MDTGGLYAVYRSLPGALRTDSRPGRRRKVFIGGVILFTLFSFLSGWASSGLALIVWRVLAGIGSAMMFGAGMASATTGAMRMVFAVCSLLSLGGVRMSSVRSK